MNLQEHLLVCLAEECSEVTQACTKALRFGLGNGYPGTDRTNLTDIQAEMADLMAVYKMLMLHINESDQVSALAMSEKTERVKKYLLYSAERGTITT